MGQIRPLTETGKKFLGWQNSSGSYIPDVWWRKIGKLHDDGKFVKSVPAVLILSSVVYAYIPVPVYDEDAINVIGYQRKFYGEKWRMNCQEIERKFDISDDTRRSGIKILEEMGLISVEIVRKQGQTDILVEPIFEAINALFDENYQHNSTDLNSTPLKSRGAHTEVQGSAYGRNGHILNTYLDTSRNIHDSNSLENDESKSTDDGSPIDYPSLAKFIRTQLKKKHINPSWVIQKSDLLGMFDGIKNPEAFIVSRISKLDSSKRISKDDLMLLLGAKKDDSDKKLDSIKLPVVSANLSASATIPPTSDKIMGVVVSCFDGRSKKFAGKMSSADLENITKHVMKNEWSPGDLELCVSNLSADENGNVWAREIVSGVTGWNRHVKPFKWYTSKWKYDMNGDLVEDNA